VELLNATGDRGRQEVDEMGAAALVLCPIQHSMSLLLTLPESLRAVPWLLDRAAAILRPARRSRNPPSEPPTNVHDLFSPEPTGYSSASAALLQANRSPRRMRRPRVWASRQKQGRTGPGAAYLQVARKLSSPASPAAAFRG